MFNSDDVGRISRQATNYPNQLSVVPEEDLKKAVRMNEPTDYPGIAKRIVRKFVEEEHKESRLFKPDEFDIYVVWFSKTLQNWKALVATTIANGFYYEVTYDGNKGCAYIDLYVKAKNAVITDF